MAMQKCVFLKHRLEISDPLTPDVFEINDIAQDNELASGQVLLKTLCLSVDPYMRLRMRTETGLEFIPPWNLNNPLRGPGVGVVLKSECDDFKENDLVHCLIWPWITTVKMMGNMLEKLDDDQIRNHPSLALGVLGITGITAHLGIEKKAFIEREKNQTVVVSGAAGGCGSIAGQVARLEGAKNVIGICGSKEKCEFLVNDLGFHGAINYRTENIPLMLEKLCPNGIDAYFDNVGGSISDDVIRRMNAHSHVIVCGRISSHDISGPYDLPLSDEQNQIVAARKITREFYWVMNYRDEFQRSAAKLSQWLAEGKLKYRETITDGIEHIGHALISLLTGGNIGKQIVKVGDI